MAAASEAPAGAKKIAARSALSVGQSDAGGDGVTDLPALNSSRR